MRLVSSSFFSAFCVFMSCSLAVRIHLLAKPVLHSCYSDLRPSAVQAWIHTARTPCGIPYTLPRLLGSLFDRCEFSRILFRGFVNYNECRWSYGANKIQIHTDVKLLSEFLSCLTNDVGRDNPSLSSLSPSPAPRTLSFASKLIGLIERVERETQNMAQVLRLLVENEILRLNVWNNPTNDPKRGVDNVGTGEKTMTDVSRLITVPPGAIADTISTGDMDNARKTNLAAEPWNCHFYDRAILSARIRG
jgi:hypothetical protein